MINLYPQDLAKLYADLKEQWHNETFILSDGHQIVMNPNYQMIIGLGPSVVPLILADLEKGVGHWYWALSAITRQNPHKETTTMEDARQAWLSWGKEKGLLAS